MNVREALLGDAEEISRLMHELGYAAGAELVQIKLRELSAASRVFVAVSDGVVSGVVSCHVIPLFHQTGNLGRITSFVVGESFRGSGVGRLLLQEAEQFFDASGCVRAEVTSGIQRDGAHKFYKAHGFAESERRFVKPYV